MKMWKPLVLQMMIRFQRVNLGFPKLLISSKFHCSGKKKNLMLLIIL